MLVNLADLTQEQTWGLAYDAKVANDRIKAQNLQIQSQNLLNSTNVAQIPLKTPQTVANELMEAAANQAYTRLLQYKQGLAIQAFNSATSEQQQQVMSALGVPDVVTDEEEA